MASMPPLNPANWVKKNPTICCLPETHITERNKNWLEVKGWRKIFQANGSNKQAGLAILISDKIDVRLKSARRENEGHFMIIKEQFIKGRYQFLTYMCQI
jgi:exonuclease III